MKLFSAILFLTGLTLVSGTGEALPWVEDFAGLSDGTVHDNGPTSWTASRNSGTFEIKDESLWVNGNGSEGELDSGDIDVSGTDLVEVTTTIYGHGGLETSGNAHDYILIFAHLDNGRRLFMGEMNGEAAEGTEITNVVDVSGISTMKLEIIVKVTAGSEHYYIQKISVLPLGEAFDGCTYYDLNMDSLAEGTYVSNQFHDSHGVDLSCNCNTCGNSNGKGDCRVFDTANPLGDPDLGAPNQDFGGPGVGNGGKSGMKGENSVPLGHILIVDENGANSVPDDAVGGDITFTFTKPVEFVSIDQLDNEGSEHYKMEFYRDGSLVTTKNGAYTGDNGYASTGLISAETKNINKMKLVLSGSGSVNSVKYRVCDNKQGGGGGDPHIKRWNRKSFDFHGECDLVLIHSDHVNGDKKLDVHIRTVIREWWSQIESAAMRIGDVTLQMDVDKFFVNGKEHSDADLPLQTAEFSIAPPVAGNHGTRALRGNGENVLKTYVVTFNDKSVVTFKVLNGFMNVMVDGHREDFEHSVGLMGTYDHGKAYGRAGTKMPSLEEFAMDWQVDPQLDPILFTEAKGPQLPSEKCRMPDPAAKESRRRLKVDDKLAQAAAVACANKGEEMEPCMNDIFATGEVSMAVLH